MRTYTFRYLLYKIHPSGKDYRLPEDIRDMVYRCTIATVLAVSFGGFVIWNAILLIWPSPAQSQWDKTETLTRLALLEPMATICLVYALITAWRLHARQPLKDIPQEIYISTEPETNVIPFPKKKRSRFR